MLLFCLCRACSAPCSRRRVVDADTARKEFKRLKGDQAARKSPAFWRAMAAFEAEQGEPTDASVAVTDCCCPAPPGLKE